MIASRGDGGVDAGVTPAAAIDDTRAVAEVRVDSGTAPIVSSHSVAVDVPMSITRLAVRPSTVIVQRPRPRAGRSARSIRIVAGLSESCSGSRNSSSTTPPLVQVKLREYISAPPRDATPTSIAPADS